MLGRKVGKKRKKEVDKLEEFMSDRANRVHAVLTSLLLFILLVFQKGAGEREEKKRKGEGKENGISSKWASKIRKR